MSAAPNTTHVAAAGPAGGGGGGEQGHDTPMDHFVQMAASTSPTNTASMRALIHQVLGHPLIYAGFAELGQVPNVVECLTASGDNKGGVGGGDGEAALRTLDLFAFGTFEDYLKAPEGTYLRLTPAQARKLKQLSLVSLIQKETSTEEASPPTAGSSSSSGSSSRQRRRNNRLGGRSNTVTYSALKKALLGGVDPPPPQTTALSSTTATTARYRDLEDELIECIYSGIIHGRLDQRRRCLVLSSASTGGATISRDVPVTAIPGMIAKFELWERESAELLRSIARNADVASETRDRSTRLWRDVEDKIAHWNQGGGGKTRGSSGGGTVAMDVDLSVAGGGVGAAAAAGGGGMDHYGSSSSSGRETNRKSKRSRGGLGVGYPERGSFRNV